MSLNMCSVQESRIKENEMIWYFLLGMYLGGAMLTTLYWVIESDTNSKEENSDRIFMMFLWPLVFVLVIGVRSAKKLMKSNKQL